MSLQEQLLTVMEKKDHWAWPRFTQPGLSKDQLLIHFAHEYQVYVRDFPVLVARVLGLGPPEDVRAPLAENIYEEQTGGLSMNKPHPALFLEMMDGLGFTQADLDAVSMQPEAVAYRRFLDQASAAPPWPVGAAVMTIFVEGSRHERDELAGTRNRPDGETIALSHPMVVHYGCPPENMDLVRAHREVEGGHRGDAWKMILDHVPENSDLAARVVGATQRALELWLAYRDSVARAMNLSA